jgi:hypothetical protein
MATTALVNTGNNEPYIPDQLLASLFTLITYQMIRVEVLGIQCGTPTIVLN